jgi:hypothetical protein
VFQAYAPAWPNNLTVSNYALTHRELSPDGRPTSASKSPAFLPLTVMGDLSIVELCRPAEHRQ